MANKNLITLARNLRKNQTDAEGLLWSKLRSNQLAGYKFRRQFPIDSYILDFYCPSALLAIEIDGGHHTEQKQECVDEYKTLHLKQRGIRLIRFWNHEVLLALDDVICEILANLSSDTGNNT